MALPPLTQVSTYLNPEGDRFITFRCKDEIIPILVAREGLKAYRLYPHEDKKNLRAGELVELKDPVSGVRL